MADWIVNQLDEKFLSHLEQLQTVNAANAASTCYAAQRQWYMPPDSAWSGNPTDIAGMNSAFDRDDLNAAYEEVVSDEDQRGRQGEAMVLKLQIDYLAALERSFRTRQASSVRSKVHAMSRRYAHGVDNGLFDPAGGSIAVWLQRMLTAAHDDPEA